MYFTFFFFFFVKNLISDEKKIRCIQQYSWCTFLYTLKNGFFPGELRGFLLFNYIIELKVVERLTALPEFHGNVNYNCSYGVLDNIKFLFNMMGFDLHLHISDIHNYEFSIIFARPYEYSTSNKLLQTFSPIQDILSSC